MAVAFLAVHGGGLRSNGCSLESQLSKQLYNICSTQLIYAEIFVEIRLIAVAQPGFSFGWGTTRLCFLPSLPHPSPPSHPPFSPFHTLSPSFAMPFSSAVSLPPKFS